MRFPLPPSYARQLRHGNDLAPNYFKKTYGPTQPFKRDRNGYYAFYYDPGLAAWLTGGMVRNGWADDEIRAEHFDERKMGTYWVRCQEDAEAASRALIDQQDRTERPMIPNREQGRILASAFLTGEVFSKKRLRALVGNANEQVTDKLVQVLVEAGVVSDAPVPHGRVMWHQYSTLTDDPGAFDDAIRTHNQHLSQSFYRQRRNVDFSARRRAQARSAPVSVPEPELREELRLEDFL